MKLLISTQSTVQFDGENYYGNSVRAMWNRYRKFGDECTLICHKKNVKVPSQDKLDSSINLVFIHRINTIKSIIRRYSIGNDKIAEEQVKLADCCIIHVPNDNGYQVIKYCRKYNKPYMTVVCGCSWDALWNHGWEGKLLAPRGYFKLKSAQKNSPFSIYVTNKFLQHRYPTNGESIGCSNVNIKTGEDGVLEKRLDNIEKRSVSGRVLRVGTAAALDVEYKGQEYVIRAIAELKNKGKDFEYHLIGLGDDSRLRRIAEDCAVMDRVYFHGALPHSQVFDFLDDLDIYIQPSKQEGLPRSMIEAMSRGCLCLGSRTAGIPELVESQFIFPKGDVKKICSLLNGVTKDSLIQQATRNFEVAKEFDSKLLNDRRERFISDFINSSKETDYKGL